MIALVTYAKLPDLADDEAALISSLARHGIHAEPVVWDDATVDWRQFDAAIIRSCWDYHLRPTEFFAWVDRVERLGVAIWNPPPVLRWNARKTYLQDLSAAGVRTVPTVWIEPSATHDERTLASILDDAGWDHAVVKPVISASAHDTWKVSRAELDVDPSHDERLRRIAATHGAMVQPLVHEIATHGERSHVFFGGVFSHAVLLRAAPGEFRVQREYGGTFARVDPSPVVLEQAKAALRAVPGRTLYARVDGFVIDDELTVTELEVLEPSLFLDADPDAADRFASVIAAVIPSGGRGGCHSERAQRVEESQSSR